MAHLLNFLLNRPRAADLTARVSPNNFYLSGVYDSMNVRKIISRSLAAGILVSSAALAVPNAAGAVDYDPAHHSTDVNDPDPAHHRPIVVFSASTGEAVLVPVAGFDLNGYPIGSGNGGTTPSTLPAGYSTDPAHHSTDLNDPDPAHHRPYFVFENGQGRYVPIPGFDINGNRISQGTFS